MAVVPSDELGGRGDAGQTDPGYLEPAIAGRADGEDDGVVALEKALVGDVVPDPHPGVESQSGGGADLVELLRDPSHALMVRGDAESSEPVGLVEALEDRHARAGDRQDLVGGVHPRRPRADDGNAEWRAVAPDDESLGRGRQQRPGPRPAVVLPVDLEERKLVLGKRRVGLDRLHRAGRDASAAIHARLRVDVEHLRAQEVRAVRSRLDAVDRAGVDARRVAAA
jgi:hypothetical protein